MEHIIPNAEYIDGKDFRMEHLYSYDVNEILFRNEIPLKKIFETYVHPNKKFITLKECIEVVNKKGDMKVIDTTIGFCYAQSLMTIIDPVKDQSRSN